ncbi:LicD family protein [Romboutsia maritimum]|uniref:LicD family protein n=1 Tax=Romboutsia maritimum TaxID=2020948 RepID=A0A371IX03_9FIRM|nr:LicD family protein [Romboutsia maritimum]RDY25012.1 LicD family protein [Romboutsia maritimum]
MFRERVNKIIEKEDISVLRKLQLTTLEIMIVIDEICRENNITYWMDAGTLLGAIRHDGFIPWDDDCDICMPRKDYEKFIKIVEGKLPDGLKYENKDSKEWSQTDIDIKPSFAKIYYLDYFKGKERGSDLNCRGVFIDIFPMDSVVPEMCSKKWARALNTIAYFRNVNPKTTKARIKYYLQQMKIENIWINKCKKLEKNKKATHIVYGIDTPFMENRYLHKKEDIYPLRELNFEGYKFFGPNNYHTYLTIYYGDYMQMPQDSERIPHIIGLTL